MTRRDPGCPRHRGTPHVLCEACWDAEYRRTLEGQMAALRAALAELGRGVLDGLPGWLVGPRRRRRDVG